MHFCKYYCDGGTLDRNSQHSAGVYWSVYDDVAGIFLTQRKVSTEYHTNNEAEYLAVIQALTHLLESNHVPTLAIIFSDSQLIVNQIKRKWRTKNPRLEKLLKEAQSLIKQLDVVGWNVGVQWVSRVETSRRLGH